MYQKQDFEILPISAMEKVRGHLRPQLFERENSALLQERFGFQVAYRCIGYGTFGISYEITGVDQKNVDVYAVKEVPCTYSAAACSDDYLLTSDSCTMPDLIEPISAKLGIVARDRYWQALYVSLHDLPAGSHKITLSLFNANKELLGSIDYTLTVIDKVLPKHDLICTYWMHYDSIAEYYNLPVFSERYNELLKCFICDAVNHGLTTLLTPLFTPALDTEIGKERLTVQLIGVEKSGESYKFDFSRLGWFMRFAEDLGVKSFEMAHLFTQWGANCTPKIVATVNGKEQKIFGWETKALGDEYKAFLTAFLPCLRTWLIENGYYDRCYFHISDEPNKDSFEQYKACSLFVKQYLFDARFMDAMSYCEYVESGLLDMPFVATSATDEFIEKGIKDYCVYYCTTQRDKFLSNRFISMPLERTRVMGIQMYQNNVRGFLHWGYNFYYSVLSKEKLNPFAVTDCMGRYQSGDAFIVYPGSEGVLGSIRNEAFYQGLQDYCALKLLEKKLGGERVRSFLQENGVAKNFHDYPKSAGWIIDLRKQINHLLSGSTY
ncbi:MAG: DUF4091 domain-containing protein [Clostridia bacterium]|nr:DUF4091 domain-containing protein [Clostridia bacterium]